MKTLLITTIALLLSLSLQSQHKSFVKKYQNGSISETGFFDRYGIRDSLWFSYYESGKVQGKAEFRHGTKIGTWVIYYENGAPMFEIFYSDGLKVKVVHYDDSGNIISTLGEF